MHRVNDYMHAVPSSSMSASTHGGQRVARNRLTIDEQDLPTFTITVFTLNSDMLESTARDRGGMISERHVARL